MTARNDNRPTLVDEVRLPRNGTYVVDYSVNRRGEPVLNGEVVDRISLTIGKDDPVASVKVRFHGADLVDAFIPVPPHGPPHVSNPSSTGLECLFPTPEVHDTTTEHVWTGHPGPILKVTVSVKRVT